MRVYTADDWQVIESDPPHQVVLTLALLQSVRLIR